MGEVEIPECRALGAPEFAGNTACTYRHSPAATAVRAAALASRVEQAAAAERFDEARHLGAHTRVAFEAFERAFEQHPAILLAVPA